MKISELLESVNRVQNMEAAPKKPAASRLASAPSLDDAPHNDMDDEDSNSLEEAVKLFQKHGSQFAPDLYSFSSIEYGEEWNARNATSLAQKLGGIDLKGLDDAIADMRSASGRDGGMTFIILNGRSGEVVSAGFGGDAISDGIVMDTLDGDQQSIVDRINALNSKYMDAGGGMDDETERGFRIRQHILSLLKYDDQSVKSDRAPLDWGNLRPSDDTLKQIAADARPHIDQHIEMMKKAKAEREARKLKKQSGPGREKR